MLPSVFITRAWLVPWQIGEVESKSLYGESGTKFTQHTNQTWTWKLFLKILTVWLVKWQNIIDWCRARFSFGGLPTPPIKLDFSYYRCRYVTCAIYVSISPFYRFSFCTRWQGLLNISFIAVGRTEYFKLTCRRRKCSASMALPYFTTCYSFSIEENSCCWATSYINNHGRWP